MGQAAYNADTPSLESATPTTDLQPIATPSDLHARMRRLRAADIILASAALVVLSPVLILVSVSVLVTSGRPIFFRQSRAGRHERSFDILKFRTMRVGLLSVPTRTDDEKRLTRLGGFLRRTSLDELPQLINVLRGEMSLVGPRPLLLHYGPHYTARERLRFLVRPGITGLAQVKGRSGLGWDDKLELDALFVEQFSARLYLRVLASTIRLLFTTRAPDTAWENEQPLDVERGQA